VVEFSRYANASFSLAVSAQSVLRLGQIGGAELRPSPVIRET
jgi:hypothetical protein